jgi:xylulokinase
MAPLIPSVAGFGVSLGGRTLVAGVDCSTQATKVLVVDLADGEVVAHGYAPHSVLGDGGARETDPRNWWDALRAAIAQTRLAGRLEAISIAGQQHGLVVLGADQQPLRPAILWNDVRCADDAKALVEELGAAQWAQRIGVVPVASLTISSWAWLRRVEPEIALATDAVRLPHDYLTERLCGEAVTDRGDASGTGWWSVTRERYDETVLQLPGVKLSPERLPRVLGPAEPAGHVRPRAAAELGLRVGTPVGPGTGDNMGAALALAAAPGSAVMSLGTSGTVYCVSQAPTSDETGIVAGFADATGRFLPLACTLNATLVVDRVAGWLGLDREAVQAGGEVVVLPFLDGERTPNLPRAAGTIAGLRHSTTPGQILRASYEGVVATLLNALDHLGAASGELDSQAPIMLVGGGARGAVWRETVSRLSGRTVEIPDAQELVALGAAVQAAAVLGGEDPAAVAGRWKLRAGTVIECRERDEQALARFRGALAATSRLNEGEVDQ